MWQLVQGGFGLSLGGGDKAVGHRVAWEHKQAPTCGVIGVRQARGLSAQPSLIWWDLAEIYPGTQV